ncbi:hypothetical protein PO909_015739, partial [Leuciscus waleckii]
QGRRDPVFLTGGSFPPDCPVCSETLIKLSVYGVNDGHQQTRSILQTTPKKLDIISQTKSDNKAGYSDVLEKFANFNGRYTLYEFGLSQT